MHLFVHLSLEKIVNLAERFSRTCEKYRERPKCSVRSVNNQRTRKIPQNREIYVHKKSQQDALLLELIFSISLKIVGVIPEETGREGRWW